mgnify:CR=1 FL=1
MVTLNNPAYSGSDEQVLEQIREKYLYKHLTLPVQMKASFLTGTVAKLTLRCDQTEVTVTGETTPADYCGKYFQTIGKIGRK